MVCSNVSVLEQSSLLFPFYFFMYDALEANIAKQQALISEAHSHGWSTDLEDKLLALGTTENHLLTKL